MHPLTAPSQHYPQQLYTLMEESPPPVPPKDTRYSTAMDADRPTSAHASASKRKRDTLDITSYNEHGEDEYTPKRRRSPLPQSDIDADASDETTPAYQKNIRRKKGSRNLSNLNLRHAAEMQKSKTLKPRESKFLEGSLTDKPSEKPPSMFMRFMRTDSGNIRQVDALMEDYHDGMPEQRDSVEQVIAQEKAMIPTRVAEMDANKENNNEGGVFSRWASSLHPVALWNKVFAQTREEIIREDFEEAERKAREKADIEARYAEMKKAGMFKPKHISNVFGSVSSRTTTHAPRDSGIVMDDESEGRESREHKRSASSMSVLPPPQEDITSASDAPEAANKPAKTLRSRMHLKKPSLTNIQGSLKRVKSDFSITQTLMHRESSSSISPVKTEFEDSALKKSHSKYDLKKQHKLSKRVSDLESKLSLARRELDEALVEASPMPKLGGRYERFTPQSTMKRPKFVPGKLPSLPSERILMAQQAKENEQRLKEDEKSDAIQGNGINLEEFLAEAQVKNITSGDDQGEGEETIKARGSRRQYPTRASSLFSLSNNNIEEQVTQTELTETGDTKKATLTTNEADERTNEQHESSQLTELPSSQINDMDPNSITAFTSNGAAEPPKQADYATLDAKLKALDANARSSKKSSPQTSAKPKKRKSGGGEDDGVYKPGKDDFTTEDSDWEMEQTPKKKRKSTGGGAANSSSPNNKRGSKSGIAGASPNAKKSMKTSPPKKGGKKINVTKTVVEFEQEQYSPNEGAEGVNGDVEMLSARTSIDSQRPAPLEPVYEAEEEEIAETTTTTSVLINDETSEPTNQATPARHAGLSGVRSERSRSPNKRLAPGAEETIITRAAEAAKSNPSRRGRSRSPPPAKGIDGHAGGEDEPMRVVPGKEGVPVMPNGKVRGKKGAKGEFEWPDDVF